MYMRVLRIVCLRKTSILSVFRKKTTKDAVVSKIMLTFALAFKTKAVGWLPEWPNGADCKSAGDAFGGSNPSPPTSF